MTPPYGVLDREGVKHVLRRAHDAYAAYDRDASEENYERAREAAGAYERAVANYTANRERITEPSATARVLFDPRVAAEDIETGVRASTAGAPPAERVLPTISERREQARAAGQPFRLGGPENTGEDTVLPESSPIVREERLTREGPVAGILKAVPRGVADIADLLTPAPGTQRANRVTGELEPAGGDAEEIALRRRVRERRAERRPVESFVRGSVPFLAALPFTEALLPAAIAGRGVVPVASRVLRSAGVFGGAGGGLTAAEGGSSGEVARSAMLNAVLGAGLHGAGEGIGAGYRGATRAINRRIDPFQSPNLGLTRSDMAGPVEVRTPQRAELGGALEQLRGQRANAVRALETEAPAETSRLVGEFDASVAEAQLNAGKLREMNAARAERRAAAEANRQALRDAMDNPPRPEAPRPADARRQSPEAAPVRPGDEVPVAPAEAPGLAHHDAQGRPIPGTEVTPEQAAAAGREPIISRRQGTTLYANPMFDPDLIVQALGRRQFVGLGTTVAGYGLSQSDDEALQKTGKTLIPLGIATMIGMRNIKAVGAAAVRPVVRGMAATGPGRRVLNFFDPEIVLTPDARAVILRLGRERAKGVARGIEAEQQAARLGPQAERVGSDLIENEAFERAALSPEQVEATLGVATRIAEHFTELGDRLVAAGQLAARTVAKRRGRYLPRLYAEHLPEAAAAERAGGAVRIRGYRARKDLSPEVRNKLGEVRELGFRARVGIQHAYGDLAAGEAFTALRQIPGTLHPEFQAVTDNLLTATRMLNEARAAAKVARGPARSAATAEYRAAWGEVKRTQRELREFRAAFRGGRGNWTALPDTDGMGPLRGAVVQREIAMALNGYRDWRNAAGWVQRFWKKSKTVWNPGTQIANPMSNVGLAHMAGLPAWEQPVALRRALRQLRSYGPQARYLAEGDVLNTGTAAVTGEGMARSGGDLKQRLRQLSATTRPETAAVLARQGITPYNAVQRAALAMDARAMRLYNTGDNVFRVALFDKATRPVARGGLGMAPAEAREYVRHRLVNYRSVSPALTLMRNTVFPFAIWPAKALPMLAAGIIEHPERWLTLMALGAAVDQYSKATAGRADNLDTPPRLRGGGRFGYLLPTSIQLPAKGNQGERYFFDPSRWLPYSSVTSGAPPGTLVGSLGDEIPGVLQPSGPWVDIGARILNREPYTGNPWISPTDSPGEIAGKGAGAAAQFATPSALGFHAPRILGHVRNRDTNAAAMQGAGLLGLRPRPTRPFMYADQLQWQLSRELADIAREYDGKIRAAARNPARVDALEEERIAKEEATYARFERQLEGPQ